MAALRGMDAREAAWNQYTATFEAWQNGRESVGAVNAACERYDTEEERRQRTQGVYPLPNPDDAATRHGRRR